MESYEKNENNMTKNVIIFPSIILGKRGIMTRGMRSRERKQNEK